MKIVGINYSGMHDSAISCLKLENGEWLIDAAISLERLTRIKQDGHSPLGLLQSDFADADYYVMSTNEYFVPSSTESSIYLKEKLKRPRDFGVAHNRSFKQFCDSLPKKPLFACHQLSHAYSAIFTSGYDECICLTYDGGMHNSGIFGGIYNYKNGQVEVLDEFNCLANPKITTLYTFFTALIGFTPNKHEGKITGMAATGTICPELTNIINNIFHHEYDEIEACLEWFNAYSESFQPSIYVWQSRIEKFRIRLSAYKKEDIAATLQDYTERHVLRILDRFIEKNGKINKLCLAGGLFSNVKLNQKISSKVECGLYVVPMMTDDGTSLGAALYLAKKILPESKTEMHSVFFGLPDLSDPEKILKKYSVKYEILLEPEKTISKLLNENKVVAIHNGKMEFGPRALGNRSILANAKNKQINELINSMLSRSEFMPFAPVLNVENCNCLLVDFEKVIDCLPFMTVTTDCSELLVKEAPAVVHADRTARPQIVSEKNQPFLHKILWEYERLSENKCLINTSFNIHEEPICYTIEDSLRTLFLSGIDYLSVNEKFLIALEENKSSGYEFAKLYAASQTSKLSHRWAGAMNTLEALCITKSHNENLMFAKELEITRLTDELNSYRNELKKKEAVISEYSVAYGMHSPLRPIFLVLYKLKKIRELFSPRLGKLVHHAPKKLVLSEIKSKSTDTLSFTIVTPSYNQGSFLERTVQSILNQKYKNVVYKIKDGGSTDNSVNIIKKYADKLLFDVSSDNGQTHAINVAFEGTDGDIMAWINSDDLVLPGTFGKVAEFFESNPGVDVLYGNRILIDENDNEIGRWILPAHNSNVMKYVDFVPQETLYWRRSAWNKIGAKLDESFSFAMDWDLVSRFQSCGCNVVHLDEFLGCFRVHQQQKTSIAINDIGRLEMERIRVRGLGHNPSKMLIKKNIKFYMAAHVAKHIKYKLLEKYL